MIRFIALALLFVCAPAAAQSSSASTGFAPEFQGKVRYFGNHSGRITTRLGVPRRASNLCPKPGGTCPEPVGGSLQVELVFDGEIVRGKYHGTGGLPDGTLIGRRNGALCTLFDTGDGSEWNGVCDARGFTGAVKSVPNAGTQVEIGFQSVGISTIDYAAIYDQWRQEKAWARQFRLLESRAYGDGSIADRLDALLQLDSRRWPVERYVPGSLGPLKKSRGTYYATFQMEGGRSGWVRAQLSDKAFTCLEYWDAPGACHPFARPAAPPPPPDRPDLDGADDGQPWGQEFAAPRP